MSKIIFFYFFKTVIKVGKTCDGTQNLCVNGAFCQGSPKVCTCGTDYTAASGLCGMHSFYFTLIKYFTSNILKHNFIAFKEGFI